MFFLITKEQISLQKNYVPNVIWRRRKKNLTHTHTLCSSDKSICKFVEIYQSMSATDEPMCKNEMMMMMMTTVLDFILLKEMNKVEIVCECPCTFSFRWNVPFFGTLCWASYKIIICPMAKRNLQKNIVYCVLNRHGFDVDVNKTVSFVTMNWGKLMIYLVHTQHITLEFIINDWNSLFIS